MADIVYLINIMQFADSIAANKTTVALPFERHAAKLN